MWEPKDSDGLTPLENITGTDFPVSGSSFENPKVQLKDRSPQIEPERLLELSHRTIAPEDDPNRVVVMISPSEGDKLKTELKNDDDYQLAKYLEERQRLISGLGFQPAQVIPLRRRNLTTTESSGNKWNCL